MTAQTIRTWEKLGESDAPTNQLRRHRHVVAIFVRGVTIICRVTLPDTVAAAV